MDTTTLTCEQTLSAGRYASYLYRVSRQDDSVAVVVRRQRRKTMALYVEKGKPAELRVPGYCAWSDVHGFLVTKLDWLLNAQAEVDARPSVPLNRYVPDGQITFLGRQLSLRLTKSRYAVTVRQGNEVLVACRSPDRPDLVEKQILNWYRREAEVLFSERINHINQSFRDSVNPGGLSVRKMKARWGSCSSRGDICLNLWLIKAERLQIDFVIAHELCHLRHFSHNDRFYALLDEIMPDWRSVDKSLGHLN